MINLIIKTAPWDSPISISQVRSGYAIDSKKFKPKDWVVIKTEAGTDMAQIIDIEDLADEIDPEKKKEDQEHFVLRKATARDMEKHLAKNKDRKKVMKVCEDLAIKLKLPIKIIDALYTFDGGRIIFAFTAPNRIDFRELVKSLAKKFHKSIRMHQVSNRQETELFGDVGPCGRPLCCRRFLTKLGNVSTKLIFSQQLSQRGPERLSGVCGRLKCCLAFEEEMYRGLSKNLPKVGQKIKTEKGEGKVIFRHILKQSVVVDVDGTRTEVPLSEIKHSILNKIGGK